MKRCAIAIALCVLTACGQVAVKPPTSPVAETSATPPATQTPSALPSASAKPSRQPSPVVSRTLLFAVLEAKGTTSPSTYNTVAIAGLDGNARAKTTFAPMPTPSLGCMAAILPRSAHVAAGKVYFADGKGVIRSLSPENKVAVVTAFPMTSSQQMLSFAVSPDGSMIVGAILSTPKNVWPCTSTPVTGSFSLDTYRASSGQPAKLVNHQTWTAPQTKVMAFVGWDAEGPLGTYPTVWASQGGGPASTLGVFVRIDAGTLKPGAPLSDPTKCQVWSSIANGAFACLKDPVDKAGGFVSSGGVRRSDGSEIWSFSMVALNAAYGAQLSPDGHQVALCCADVQSGFAYQVLNDRGAIQVLAQGFEASAWTDTTTLVGQVHPNPIAQPPFELAYVALNSPQRAVSMGFRGLFVGTVRG